MDVVFSVCIVKRGAVLIKEIVFASIWNCTTFISADKRTVL